MGTYNILRTEIPCPHCKRLGLASIEMFFGDTLAMREYAIGDHYDWLPRKAVQNGGRPDGGDLDGEGYAECPHCGTGFYVIVQIRKDVIRGIEPDLDKGIHVGSVTSIQDEVSEADMQPNDEHSRRNRWAQRDLSKPGRIDTNPNWNLTEKRKIALQRLAELGVSVGSSVGTDGFTLNVPFDLHPDIYVEVGYLIAQLGDEEFPKGFHHPIAYLQAPTELFDCEIGASSPVEARDVLPTGFRYRVKPMKEQRRG